MEQVSNVEEHAIHMISILLSGFLTRLIDAFIFCALTKMERDVFLRLLDRASGATDGRRKSSVV